MPTFAQHGTIQHSEIFDTISGLGVYNLTENEDFALNQASTQAEHAFIVYPTYRVNLNEESYALIDENNNIVRINRYDEINELHQNNIQTHSSNFDSISELQSYIEDQIIPPDYQLTNSYYFDDYTLSLRYERILPSGALDNFDVYTVDLDLDYLELVSLIKKSDYVKDTSSEHSAISSFSTLVSRNEAITTAAQILDIDSDLSVELATVKCNDIFTEGNVTIGEIREAYIISNSNYGVYVDSSTGNIIGGEVYKALGGAIGAKDLTIESASVNNAADKLEEMGYYPTATLITDDFASKVPSYLNRTFYVTAHGSYNSISSNSSSIFYADDVPSKTYNFVFLDACNTYSATWRSAFNIGSGSTNKAFLGWTDEVVELYAYEFAHTLWQLISPGYSVRQAALEARDSHTTYLPISFAGDTSFDGYY